MSAPTIVSPPAEVVIVDLVSSAGLDIESLDILVRLADQVREPGDKLPAMFDEPPRR